MNEKYKFTHQIQFTHLDLHKIYPAVCPGQLVRGPCIPWSFLPSSCNNWHQRHLLSNVLILKSEVCQFPEFLKHFPPHFIIAKPRNAMVPKNS